MTSADSPKPLEPNNHDARVQFAIDTRAELLTILFRLSVGEEFAFPNAKHYDAEVEAYFKPFVKHPAVVATQAIRKSAGIGYNAPSALAVALDDKLALRKLSGPLSDDRWQRVDLNAYLEKVRDFAKISQADKFFAAHRVYYENVANRFEQKIAAKNIVSWFDALFGARPKARYIVAPGRHFAGDHLVVIACAAKPHDETHGAVVYAAAEESDVIGINAVFHGPTDWVVAEKNKDSFEVVANGDF